MLWTEFGDCISGGLLDFLLFLPLLSLLPLGSADLTLGKPGIVDLLPDQISMLGRVSGDGGAYREEV